MIEKRCGNNPRHYFSWKENFGFQLFPNLGKICFSESWKKLKPFPDPPNRPDAGSRNPIRWICVAIFFPDKVEAVFRPPKTIISRIEKSNSTNMFREKKLFFFFLFLWTNVCFVGKWHFHVCCMKKCVFLWIMALSLTHSLTDSLTPLHSTPLHSTSVIW